MTVPNPAQIQVGSVLDSGTEVYEIVAELGKGGMGVVYKARQRSFDRLVAIKLLPPDTVSSQALQRLMNEARLCANLTHPNIVRVYGFASDKSTGRAFLVMEFIEGKTLEQLLLEEGKLDRASFIELFDKILSALEYAHERGLVHRDIKPSNIMITADGQPRLMDFGIAKDVAGQRTSAQTVTQTGALVGSPWYMSPEQCSGEKADARSDLYSVACVMYECACGKRPFAAENPIEVMYKHLHDQLSTTAEVDIPYFSGLICRGMHKSPEDRYQSASAMREELHETSSAEAIARTRRRKLPHRPTKVAPLAVACVAALLATAFVWKLHSTKTAKTDQPVTVEKTAEQLVTEVALIRKRFDSASDFKEKIAIHQELLRKMSEMVDQARARSNEEYEAKVLVGYIKELVADPIHKHADVPPLTHRALELLRRYTNTERARFLVWVHLATAEFALGHRSEAIQAAQEALRLKAEHKEKFEVEDPGLASLQLHFAPILYALGMNEAADKEAASGLVHFENTNLNELASQHQKLGATLLAVQQNARAVAHLEKAYAILHDELNFPDQAPLADRKLEALWHLANAYLQLGNYPMTQKTCRKAIKLAEGTPRSKWTESNKQRMALVNYWLGSSLLLQQRYQESRAPFETSLALFDKGNIERLGALHQLFWVYGANGTGDLRRCQKIMNELVETGRKLDTIPEHLADSLHERSVLMLWLHEPDKAEADANEALELMRAHPRIATSQRRALLYMRLAQSNLLAGKMKDARQNYKLAKQAALEPGVDPTVRAQSLELYEMFMQKGKQLNAAR